MNKESYIWGRKSVGLVASYWHGHVSLTTCLGGVWCLIMVLGGNLGQYGEM